MLRWDHIEEEAEQLFEDTHPWLFNPGMTPEIIENEDTIRRERKNNIARENIIKAINKKMAQIIPPKEPPVYIQKELLP